MINGMARQLDAAMLTGPHVIGIDEVNYSPSIAGDTIICACRMFEDPPKELMKDSKKTNLKQRLRAFDWLQWNSLYVIEVASVNHIGLFGVHAARSLAMYRAAMGIIGLSNLLADKPGIEFVAVVDGPPIKELAELWKMCPPDNADLGFVIDGDDYVPAISAASIAAKVYVDAMFEGWEKFWPGCGMNNDHGSPSKRHEEFLKQWGPSPIHRQRGYAPDWWTTLIGEVPRDDRAELRKRF